MTIENEKLVINEEMNYPRELNLQLEKLHVFITE